MQEDGFPLRTDNQLHKAWQHYCSKTRDGKKEVGLYKKRQMFTREGK